MHRPPRTAAPAAPEKIHYNFSDYPVYIRRDHLSQYPNYSGTAHWHEDPEFILILSGHMIYNVNGRRIHLTEGSGILVNSCQFHHGFSAGGSDCEFICIIVSPLLLSANEYFERTYIAPILKNEDFPWLLLSPETDWQQGMLDCLRDIFLESREKNHFLEIQQQLLRLWGLLYRHTAPAEPGTAAGNPRLTAVKQMTAYIHRHYREKIKLDEIAAAGNVCRSSCHALFRTYLSRTPMEYLTEYRLRQSLDSLLHSALPISEIGNSIGIGSPSYYSELFRKYFHCTPGDYRRSRRTKEPSVRV